MREKMDPCGTSTSSSASSTTRCSSSTRRGEQLGGCLICFATQCSIDPPRFLVCLSDKNRTTRLARDAEAVAVHIAFLLDPTESHTGTPLDEFTFHRARRIDPGHQA